MRCVARCVIAMVVALSVVGSTAWAARSRLGEVSSADEVLRWISAYRTHPDPADLPNAIKALSRFGAFKDPEAAGVYVGFIAGIIASNPSRAEELIGKMTAIPPEDHWVIVRGTVYSGLPQWKVLLTRAAERMPTRKRMIEKYLNGELPTFDQMPFDAKVGWFDTMRDYFTWDHYFGKKPRVVMLEPNPELLDALWGFYFATGSDLSLTRIVSMLPWSKDRDNIDKLTLGSMAKYTLVRNAVRDADLLVRLQHVAKAAAAFAEQNGKADKPEAEKQKAERQKEVAPILKEVVEAAETADTARIHKEALASIQQLQQKGPGSKRDMAWWGKVGEGAVSAGCLTAAALGQAALGVPCVLGGGLSSAALQFWSGQ
jgi:hypothetical protein